MKERREFGFDVKKTDMVKCVAIILMLMHHVFGCSLKNCQTYGVFSLWIPWERIMEFSVAAKVCVAMYVFLTAYGLTVAYNKNIETLNEKKNLERFCINRYVKLAMSFFFVYVLALVASFWREVGPIAVYKSLGNNRGIIYAFFDAMGLASYFGTPTLNETWWYMSLAILLIFIVPIFVMMYKRIGKILVVFGFFVGSFGIFRGDILSGYLFATLMGILFANEKYFEKIHEFSVGKNPYVSSVIKLLIAALLFFTYMFKRGPYVYWLDVCAPITVGVMMMECAYLLPFTERILGFVGKHSMNMFLIHTLIFKYHFKDIVYGAKYWLVILVVLFGTSLVGSMLIEALKKIVGYTKLMDWCIGKKKSC